MLDPARRIVTVNGDAGRAHVRRVRDPGDAAGEPGPGVLALAAARQRLGVVRLPRAAHGRRPHPAPAREDRARAERAAVHPDGTWRGLSLRRTDAVGRRHHLPLPPARDVAVGAGAGRGGARARDLGAAGRAVAARQPRRSPRSSRSTAARRPTSALFLPDNDQMSDVVSGLRAADRQPRRRPRRRSTTAATCSGGGQRRPT